MKADIRNVKIEHYYPDVLANAKEFKTLSSLINPELKNIWASLWKQFINTFVYSLDIDGARRWESMLKLHPSSTDSLDTRRKAILARINATLPYTHRSFQSMLDGIYGKNNVLVSLNHNKYECWLDIAANFLYQSKTMRTIARVIIPANLSIAVSNTKTGNLNEYCGITMQKFKRTTIRPGGTFAIENPPIAEYTFAGAIKRMVHITLRS